MKESKQKYRTRSQPMNDAPTASEGIESFVEGLAAQQRTNASTVQERFSPLKRFAKPAEVGKIRTRSIGGGHRMSIY
jgi:hypothetical protein